MHTKFEMKPLPLVFDFGALITCAVVGVSLGFAHADVLQLDPERSATIAKTSSEGSARSGTVANFGVGRDIDTLSCDRPSRLEDRRLAMAPRH